MSMRTALLACAVAGLGLASLPGNAAVLVYRVDADTPAAPGTADGQSWATAFPTLPPALALAQGGDEVWVAEGVYYPTSDPGDRAASFSIPDGVIVYGGFAGTESAAADRDPAGFPCVLSGDIAHDDGPGLFDNAHNNSYHVVHAAVTGSPITRIEGFTITGGYAVTPLLGDYVHGGALWMEAATLTVARCIFTGNAAGGNGGAVYARDSTLLLEDCAFAANRSSGFGACVAVFPDRLQERRARLAAVRCAFEDNLLSYALCAAHTDVALDACRFIGNEGGAWCATDRVALDAANVFATGNGGLWGAVYVGTRSRADLVHCTLAGDSGVEITVASEDAEPSVLAARNSIVWNEAAEPIVTDGASASVVLTGCIARGAFAGAGNLEAEPRFRLGEPPLRPSWDSPAIDRCPDAGVTEDVLGEARPQNAAYDAGAYEFGEDGDGGGLPDAYEARFGLDAGDEGDDGVDSDGDGLSNREEFARDTLPDDADDPPSAYFVSPGGSDSAGDGSPAMPWATIGFALRSIPEATPAFRVTIHLGPGVYGEPVTMRPYTDLIGAGASTTTIRHFDPADDEHVVLAGAEGAVIEACTITLPQPVTASVELVRIENVATTLRHCTINGLDGTNTIGIFITGAGSSNSSIANCALRRCEYGVFAVDSAVNITRNLFEDMLEGGIFIRPPEDLPADAATPLVGDSAAGAATAFNRFRVGDAFTIRNLSGGTTKAELNDWGVYTAVEIEATVAGSIGDVDYEPFLGKALVRGSLAVEVLDEDTGDRIAAAANPSVSVDGEGVRRDAPSSLFLFTDLDPGSYLCVAAADGYAGGSVRVDLPAGEVYAVNLELAAQAPEGEGEGEGEGEDKENRVLLCGPAAVRRGGAAGDIAAIAATAALLGFCARRRQRKS